jgi:N-acetylmuramoyl-L-alanine amidase
MRWINHWAGIGLALPMLLAGQAAQTPAPAPAAQTTPAAPAAPMPPVPAAPGLPGTAAQVAPRFLILLDAAHGGSDIGTKLNSSLLEKDLTLDLANQLRSMFAARGIGVTVTRSSDVTLPADSRAEIANRTPFSACLLIHATATGSGVHLYTSSLAPAPLVKFMPWQTAQSAYVTQSLKLSSDIDSALAHAEIPVTLGRTSLQPMDSFACPAVAVEIAPLQAGASTKARAISDEGYQRSILDALSAAIDQWRNDWRQQP